MQNTGTTITSINFFAHCLKSFAPSFEGFCPVRGLVARTVVVHFAHFQVQKTNPRKNVIESTAI